MKKKKICMITNWYPTEENPYQGLFFREQAIALSDHYDFIVLHHKYESLQTELCLIKQEYNITEYTANLNRLIANRWVKKYIIDTIGDEDYLLKKIYKRLGKENIDMFYSISGQTEASITFKYAKHFNKPYIISEHGPFPWVGTLITDENKVAMEKADAFLAISNDKIRQILMQGLKLPPIYYVGNMVDDEIFTLVEPNNEIKTFITIGANVFYKNYSMLIETFNKLYDNSEKPFKLIVAGYKANKGYSQDATELERKLKEAKFGSNVELIPYVPHDEMPHLFNRADAFVMTSIQEGQPVSAIEAGCCGLPIFATRCGGIEDYVDDRIGKIVDILDSCTLANHLNDYLEGRIEFSNELIRNVVRGKFGKKAFVNNIVKVIDEYV